MRHYDILIVGGGHGGAQAAIALRQRGFAGSIAIVGEEAELPYERPPLSKEYLSGEKELARILIRPPAFWSEREIELLLDRRVDAVDPAGRTVTTQAGESLGYGNLIWAAGGRPRKLSCAGNDLTGVHAVRNLADVNRLMTELPGVNRAVVIGGGYIGLEAAAVLVKLGKQVTIVEVQDRVLARVAGDALSRFYEAEHRAHGVDIRLGAAVECIEGESGRATGVRLADGTILPAEIVIVGIGIIPSIEPLLAAGAWGDNGVAIDEHCRSSLPHIFAIGDCALHSNAWAGGTQIRLESVQNANDMATTAARAIVGDLQPYDAIPWFWSSQYDLRLQTVGLSLGHDEAVLRGDPESRSFSVVYLKNGQVIALDCINATKDFVQGKALVASRAAIASDQLRARSSLKELVALAASSNHPSG